MFPYIELLVLCAAEGTKNTLVFVLFESVVFNFHAKR